MAKDELMWTDVAPVVVRPLIYAYKFRGAIQSFWKGLQVKAGLGSISVIITGRAGVGKSVLASHYHGEANTLDWNEPGTSSDVEIKPIKIGDWTKIVSVIPGQNTAERAHALDKAINKTALLDGVIHVVDWGFTSIRDAAVKSDMIEIMGIDSIAKVREHNLALELKDFESTLDKLEMSILNKRGPKWIVIAVNKADLYHEDLKNAERYYSPDCISPFADKIKSFYERVGKFNVKIIHLPMSSMPAAFEWNNTSIAPHENSNNMKRNYLRLFIEKIASLQNGIK